MGQKGGGKGDFTHSFTTFCTTAAILPPPPPERRAARMRGERPRCACAKWRRPSPLRPALIRRMRRARGLEGPRWGSAHARSDTGGGGGGGGGPWGFCACAGERRENVKENIGRKKGENGRENVKERGNAGRILGEI